MNLFLHTRRVGPGSRGFTLIELMVALVLSVLVVAVVYRLLLNTQRVSRAQHARVGIQDNVRAGATIVTNELRELGYDSVPAAAGPALVAAVGSSAANSDLLLAQPGRVRYRAMRGFGVTCVAPTSGRLVLRRSLYSGLRDPVAGDDLAIFVEGSPTTGLDDAWVQAAVVGAAPGPCADGAPGIGVSVTWPLPAVATAAVPGMVAGGPVRSFEVMEMQYYVSGGKSWLGMRSVSAGGSIEPLVGPLADSTGGTRGMTLSYLDKDDLGTATLDDVRTIALELRGITDERVYRSGGQTSAVDTLSATARVALRNALRP